MMICSPYNLTLRRFLEEEVDIEVRRSGPGKEAAFLKAFLTASLVPESEKRDHGMPEYTLRLKDSYRDRALANKGYSWMDIADCLVDFKAEKMWVRNK